MDRFNELERRWNERQKKRKLALLVIGGSMVIYLVIYIAMPRSSEHVTNSVTPAPTAKPEAEIKTVEATPQSKPEVKTPSQPTPQPEPAPEPELKTAEQQPLKDPLTITLDRTFEEKIDAALARYRQKQTRPPRVGVPEEGISDTHAKRENNTGLQIKSETVDDSEKISLLIDNYEFDETYENAMKITRHYFASQKYREAITWALTANQLDSADDESWLIYAKASIAVGETEQAKKALQTYLLKRDSLRIRQLYQTIK